MKFIERAQAEPLPLAVGKCRAVCRSSDSGVLHGLQSWLNCTKGAFRLFPKLWPVRPPALAGVGGSGIGASVASGLRLSWDFLGSDLPSSSNPLSRSPPFSSRRFGAAFVLHSPCP